MPDDGGGGQATTGPSDYLTRVKSGGVIFHEGDAGKEMFIIQEGQVEILKSVGGKDRQVAVLEEGDFFGETALLEEIPRTASARALTNCVLLRIDGSTFDHMARQNPEIPIRMLRKLSRRLRETAPHLLDAGPTPVAAAAQVTGETSVSPPKSKQAPAGVNRLARFVNDATGTEFFLSPGPETHVGRYDASTGFQPGIDLKDVDTARSTSRRHAKVMRGDDSFVLREEIGTANGTYVNGKRIPTGVDVEIKDGDEVRFGRVKMVFHTR